MKKFLYMITFLLLFSLVLPSQAYSIPDRSVASPGGWIDHPILSEQAVRQAIAYCIDKHALVASAYPDLTQQQQADLVLDTNIVKSSWAYSPPATLYPFNVDVGKRLLDGAGWTLQPGDFFRTKNGPELAITLTSTSSSMRMTYLPVLKDQLAVCGIRVILNFQNAAWFFGGDSGLRRRDFELTTFAWVTEEELGLAEIYSCQAVPSPANGWTGQNYLGWCNTQADNLLALADDLTKSQEERKANYADAMEILLDELPTIPLFIRDGSPAAFEHLDFNLELTASNPTPQSHPVLKDNNVRQAIAYCIDKAALVEAAYPDLSPTAVSDAVLDTYVYKSHWAYSEPGKKYAYLPETGKTLLQNAGWDLPPTGSPYRVKNGKELAVELVTTDIAIRHAYGAVLEQQMAACGIHLTVRYTNSGWLFGPDTGLHRRDFELASYGWLLNEESTFSELYSCSSITSPSNDWAGQNFSGWCNPGADEQLAQGDDVSQALAARKAAYASAFDLVLEDLPSIPLFERPDSPMTVEHIDLNLDTYDQVASVATGVQTDIPFSGFSSTGMIKIPPGAIDEPVDMEFIPLKQPENGAPEAQSNFFGFQISAIQDGQVQGNYIFQQPVRIILTYHDSDLVNMDETTLRLFLWMDGAWQDASETCPVGQRYFSLDTELNILEADICHLTEFSVIGDNQYLSFIPILKKP